VASGTPQGRYDLLFAHPGESLVLSGEFALSGPALAPGGGFLDSLDAWWNALRVAAPVAAGAAEGLPFTGGWFLFLAYELLAETEPSLRPRPLPGLPVAVATRVPAALVLDRATGMAWAVAEAGHESFRSELRADLLALERAAPPPPTARRALAMAPPVEPAAEVFLDAVSAARHRIAAGDIYQANLSRRWTAQLHPDVSQAEVYRRLRETNPAPFAGLADFGAFAIVSSSPERLVRVVGGVAETRPIAGTRPRSSAPGADEQRRRDLLANPKERAEHIMLIDLERNDLGRICESGSVAVTELMVVESYSHVHHIVSNVAGRLRSHVTPGALLKAVFPGGTITGCPKVRCMEIIAELEGAGRGPYTGALGYVNHDGDMDLNILIRTLSLDGTTLRLRAGAGIVADSDAARELEETRSKAEGLLRALRGDYA
jgi:anthranilate synthase component 1